MTERLYERAMTGSTLGPNQRYRIVYFGTPAYAVPALRSLAADPRFEVTLVVSQPDRPAGRGHTLTQPEVARAAVELGLPLYQTGSLRMPAEREPLLGSDADLFVVAAFGLIFGPRALAIPRRGCVNLHASLLPSLRGANPIAAAIAEGHAETGISVMLMDADLDTGPIIDQVSASIFGSDTTQSLTERLAELGGRIVGDALADLLSGAKRATPQSNQHATVTRPMRKADGWIDWSRSAEALERHVRAMWPWPRAWTQLSGQLLQVHQSAVATDDLDAVEPHGTAILSNGEVLCRCGSGSLRLVTVQPAGKPAVATDVWLRRFGQAEVRFDDTPPEGPSEPLVRPAARSPAS